MSKIIARLLPLLLLGQILSGGATAQQRDRSPNLNSGDAVVTGFSGTIAPDPAKPLPRNKTAIDLTFIDPDGPSARVINITQPGYVWDGRLFAAPKLFDVLAKDVGQVFGVALDDAAQPNIYVAATSVFGLNIVSRGRDGSPERKKKGGPGAGWMKGQFGLDLQGGPGAIYKIDGRTGVPTLFANVTLDAVPNPGAGLGNLAYDPAHKQLFVSDLYTGMIHRFDLDGKELSRYDHGITGLGAAKLPTVAFNPQNRPNIASDRFDSEKPDSWGFAPAPRRVWGLAVHENRLYYSVLSGPQIWSVGIERDGSFAPDPRWELDVPAQAGPLPISDIAFSNKGAMILAQRALIAGAYDYSAFTRPGEPQVFRIWLKGPNDPPSPGRWKPVPEEYAVGFAGNFRNTNGGVALGYGYAQDGMLGATACEFSLWTTGQNLRNNPALRRELEPGGSLVVHGIAGMPASPVRTFNEPPWVSYFVDYDDAFDDPRAAGHMGSIRIYSQPCPATAVYGGPGYAANAPYIFGGGGGGSDCVGPKCNPTTPVDVSVVKTGGTTPVQEPYYSFTLTISNNGAPFTGANNISVTDVLPPLMSFTNVSAAPASDWSCPTSVPVGGTLTCTYIGSGPTGTGVIGTITINALAGGSAPYPPIKNCATVGIAPNSGYTDSDPSNNNSCVTITKPKPPIDVAIEKTGTATPGPVNTALTYALKVTNKLAGFSGNGAIVVSDPAPAGVTYTGVTWTAIGDWACTFTASNIDCHYTGSGPVSPNELIGTITVTATASGDGPWTNCATVAVDQGAGTDSNADNNKSCITLKNDGFTPVNHPPEISPSCGVNVIFVVDVSGSIAQAGAINQVLGALNGAKQMFNNVNSGGVHAQGAVITFSNTATVVQPMSASTLTTWTPLTFGGETNWEAAMQAAYTVAQSSPTPVIIIFITDGIPNRTNSSSGTVDSVTATNAAIPIVNQIYGLGVPILGLGMFGSDPQGPIHLHALLGGHDQASSYNGLYSDLQTFAKNQCPDVYLSKYINPNHINYYNNPGPHTVDVTLTLQNTAGALTGVQVQDALPPQLTNPTSADPHFSHVGDVVTWNIGNLAATTTVAMTFTATVVPPALSCNAVVANNFAQVTHVDQTVHSVPNNFPNPVTGPVHEHDEAMAAFSMRDCAPIQGTPYLQVKKTSLESCLPVGQQLPVSPPTPPPACSFTVTIQAVGNFVGNVLFGDGIFTSPGGTPVASNLSSVTLTPPPVPSTQTYCASSFTTTAASCTQNNVTLNNGHMITYTFTLAAPPNLAPGNYKNCFMAAQDNISAAQKTLPYYDANAPISQWVPWGDCGVFTVPSSAQGIIACPQGTTRQVKNGASACLPPPSPTCVPPMVAGPVAGQCICPTGTVPQGGECVKPPTCQPPMVSGPVAGQCICGPGYTLRGKECVKTIVCRPPLLPNAAGTDCVCRPGLVLRKAKCVEPVVCRLPAKLNSAGTACTCPEGMTKKGNTCVEKEKQGPRITPNDVINGIGIIRGIGGGGGRGGNGGGGGGGPAKGGGGSPGKP